MEARLRRMACDRALGQKPGRFMAAALVLDQAEQVEGVGMLGRRFERPAVVRRCGGEVAVAMLREARRERNLRWIGDIDRFHSNPVSAWCRALPVRQRALGEVALDLV